MRKYSMKMREPSRRWMAKSINRYVAAAEEMIHGKTTFSWNSNPVRAVPADWIRVASSLELGDTDVMIRNMLLNAFVSAESRYVGSSIGMMLESDINSKKSIANKRIEFSDLEQGLKSFLGDGLCFESTLRVFEQVGHDSTVGFVTSVQESKMVVKSKNAVKIPGTIANTFSFNVGKLNGASVVAINGALESIAEMESIIKSAAEIKKSVVVLASSFDADIIRTLEHNWKSGALRVLPFKAENYWSGNDVGKLVDLGIIPIDLENFMELRTIDADKLSRSNVDLLFDDDGMQIRHETGEYRLTEVMIPKHMSNLAGLIEDRILNGLAYCRLASMTGLQSVGNKAILLPTISYNQSKKVNAVLQSNLSNLGLVLEID